VKSGRRPNFQGELAKHALTKRAIAAAKGLPSSQQKRTIALAFFTSNATLSDNDRERAAQQQIALFDQDDLSYYETLTHHLGPAARYQFLSDLLPGKQIPGLTIRVPAVRTKMGGYYCYSFAISPEKLLKVAYVSHRAKGKASDLNTYQRMISRSRLRGIAEYISDDGIFPTNIVVNLERGKSGSTITFDKAKQEDATEEEGEFGWLTVRPGYKSAWIIDGQHRLFAYSGHPKAAKSVVFVLAFEGLPGGEQLKLFTDINAKQKSVKQSLLQELYADLHLRSDNPAERVQALISRAIQALGNDHDSPLHGRLLLADSVRTFERCISLNALFSALDKPGFYFGSVRKGIIHDQGPLWTDDSETTIKRSIAVLKAWMTMVRQPAADWWDLGSAPGGGLAMNDGATVGLNVLRSVIEQLSTGKTQLHELSTSELIQRLTPYGKALGQHFASMSEDERRGFRQLRGVQGQTAGVRHAQASMQSLIPSFTPAGLDEFLEQEKAQTNEQAYALITEIERILSETVLEELKANYDGDKWWYDGVPKSARQPATQRQEEDNNSSGSKEAYLNLIDYRTIIESNWQILGEMLGMGTGARAKRTLWINDTNEIRKIAMHASKGATVSFDQLSRLAGYRDELRKRGSASEDKNETND
jgi:DGQHR domain-containing protein